MDDVQVVKGGWQNRSMWVNEILKNRHVAFAECLHDRASKLPKGNHGMKYQP